jgi:hypothetical protein
MSLIDEVPKRKWAPCDSKDFLTQKELEKATGEGKGWCENYIKAMLESSQWEIRYKRFGTGRPVKAYGHDPVKSKLRK